MKRAIGLLVAITAVLTFVGCSNRSRNTRESARIEVGLVSPALVSTFHVTLVEGAKEEAKELGWLLRSVAPDKESNFASQVSMIEDLIQSKVRAISICAIDDKAIVGAVRKANAAGIPIFIHNSLTEIPGGKVTAYIGYDQREGGRKCGEKAVQLLTQKYGKPKGQVAIIQGLPGFHTRERSGGFKEALAKYPEIKIVADRAADWERDKAVTVAENMLQANGKIDLFFGCSDAMAQGAAAAARLAGKKVFTIGLDGNPDAILDVSNGKLTATLAVYPREMGQTVIKTMKDVLDGKQVPKFVKTPTTIVDKSNCKEFLK
ncbi:MAG: sugar ABC transporter substrate-binding protein [Armatimonadetes bacterium]|nr:sugar ABC transporter substrate-binding protein [Armatimonadota bacterium]